MVEKISELNKQTVEEGELEPLENPGQAEVSCWRFESGAWQKKGALAAVEFPLQVFLNGAELVTILCTPIKMNCLVAGFLFNEGIISSIKDIAAMRVCEEDYVADVRLTKSDYVPPARRMLTSGCGGGASFIEGKSNLPVISSEIKINGDDILILMKQLYQKAEIHQNGGGVHASALCDSKSIIVLAEDIGRHNTLDKIAGESLLMGIPTRDRILITTGRISSEMLLKAGRMGVPVIVSRGAPLTRAIALGEKIGITVIGYARADHLEVYSHGERLMGSPL